MNGASSLVIYTNYNQQMVNIAERNLDKPRETEENSHLNKMQSFVLRATENI
jgi:hypothetical protein